MVKRSLKGSSIDCKWRAWLWKKNTGFCSSNPDSYQL